VRNANENSVEMGIEKLPHPDTCIVRCIALVFHPVTKQRPAGLTGRFTAIPIPPHIEASEQEFRL